MGVRFAFGATFIAAAFTGSTLANSCPVKTILAVTDAQQGFAGKTGTIWQIFPGCRFNVARLLGAAPAEPHRQGQLTQDQESKLSALIAATDIARLPPLIGGPAQTNARTISLEYDGSASVLVMPPGDLGVSAIESAGPNDPGHRLMELARALHDMLGPD